MEIPRFNLTMLLDNVYEVLSDTKESLEIKLDTKAALRMAFEPFINDDYDMTEIISFEEAEDILEPQTFYGE